MESHRRNLETPQLQANHIKQEKPEKLKALREPMCTKQELYQVELVSVKEEFPEREQAREESYEEVNCVRIKEEMLEPVHIHRVFPDLGLFTTAQLSDKSENSTGDCAGDSAPSSCSLQFGSSKDMAQSVHWGQGSLQQHSLRAACLHGEEGPVPEASLAQPRPCSRNTPQHFTIHAECFTPRMNFPRFQHLESDHKPYICGVCGKTFRRTDHLKRHQSMHLGEKPFQCVRCDKRFSLRRSLETHLRQCMGELTCRCPVCGDVFQSFSNLHRHQLIHNGEKSYECSRCGQHYKQSDYFKRHQKVLSDDRPYYCLECENTQRVSPSANL